MKNYINPSYLNSINDILIPYHLLKFCIDSYRNEYDNENDPFISPILMPDNVLKCLPPIRILVGSTDPLRDDSFLFLKRLV